MSQFWNGEVLAAPNLITVCVDESQASEISGRLYHGYSQEPQSFENVVQLIRYMADFYDSIRFPESSVVLREFSPEKRAMEKLHEKSVEYEQLMEQSGICATFHIFVKYRQNATWQGILAWKEGHQEMEFCSVLELIIEMDAILGRKTYGGYSFVSVKVRRCFITSGQSMRHRFFVSGQCSSRK